ncbi:MAG: Fic family protein [Nitrospirota bacterium]
MSFCSNVKAIQDIQKKFKWTNRTKFRNRFINPLLREGLMEMTISDKPNSRLQKYRLTEKGRALLKKQTQEAGGD